MLGVGGDVTVGRNTESTQYKMETRQPEVRWICSPCVTGGPHRKYIYCDLPTSVT